MPATAPTQPPLAVPGGLLRLPARLASLPSPLLFLLFFAAVALGHLTLLRLPYFWDEGGYYVPAALDFFHRWTLIPEFTNAHPPLPNVVLGLLWHLTGFHIVATRLCAAAFAAAGLTAIFRLGERLLTPAAGLALAILTGLYSIWFAQSTLAHADIFAAAFVLWGFAEYLAPTHTPGSHRDAAILATLFSLAALSKETAILQPVALACVEAVHWLRTRRHAHRTRFLALLFPVLPLAAWYAFHHAQTGFTFGNPEYLRYNATANFTLQHVISALRIRAIHLSFQRDIWLPLALAAACLFLRRRPDAPRGLSRPQVFAMVVLIAANWLAFSVLGGALLTRYLLPVYPLILLLCLALWQRQTPLWPLLASISAAAFISSWWLSPPIAFAPEDNLTYRDMVLVHQHAIDYLNSNFPNATVLTAWPVSANLVRPELGYTPRKFRVTSVDDFTLSDILQAGQEPGRFDTAVVFTTHYISPTLTHYLASHPDSPRGREFTRDRDLTPEEIAHLLHGTIVWSEDRHGEMAAILRFPRAYEAELRTMFPLR